MTQDSESKSGKGSDFLGYLFVFLVVAVILVFVIAFVHDVFTGTLFNEGNIDKECFDYQTQSGEWSNSCDSLGDG
jgi:hypothetical protein